tara:strand:+ start:1075 stop:1302 length:228 start_codon:yes stop_codon:yes gene_type:complete
MSNVIVFRSKLHSKQIANSIISKESDLAVARSQAAWHFKEGDPANPYKKNSPCWVAYEKEFFNIYMVGLYAEQGQ